jgi:hypothetical protein
LSVTYNRSVIWFSQSTPVSFTSKTDHHHIIDILLKVVLNTLTQGGPPPPLPKIGKNMICWRKKIAPSGERRENFWGISCEKSRFYAKKSYFFLLQKEAQNFLGYFVWKITILRQKIIFFPIAEGGTNFLGVFRVKNHDLRQKIISPA